MRSLVAFLVSHDEDTDAVQALAEDVAHIYGPGYVGIIDYTVRVDVPSCFVLDGSNAAKEAVDAVLAPLSWEERARIEAESDQYNRDHNLA